MALNNCRRQNMYLCSGKDGVDTCFHLCFLPKTQNRGQSLEPTWFTELSKSSGTAGTRHL